MQEAAKVDPQQLCSDVLEDIRRRQPALAPGDFRLLPRPHDDVADSGTKAVVFTHGSDQALGLLVVSSPIDPFATERAVEVTRGARSLLGPDAGSVVLEPLSSGRVGGRAYVLWPFHRVLNSSRAANLLRRVGLYPKVLRWLRDVTAQTARPVPAEQRNVLYGATLLSIADEAHFPTHMRDAAGRGLLRLKGLHWQPFTAFEHNDLWIGNVLMPRDRDAAQRHPRGFIVIDWEGARFEGYPVLDLVRFALSSRMPKRWLHRELLRMRDLLRCELSDMPSYVLAALGAMGQNLGYFPAERFRVLAIEAYEAARQAC